MTVSPTTVSEPDGSEILQVFLEDSQKKYHIGILSQQNTKNLALRDWAIEWSTAKGLGIVLGKDINVNGITAIEGTSKVAGSSSQTNYVFFLYKNREYMLITQFGHVTTGQNVEETDQYKTFIQILNNLKFK